MRLQSTVVELGEYLIDSQKGERFLHAGCRAIAAPLPVLDTSNQLRPDGVQYDVAAKLKEIRIFLYEDCLEAAWEEMPNAVMMSVECLGVGSVELTHPARQRGINRFDKEVIVVGPLAVLMTEPVEAIAGLVNDLKERNSIVVIEEDVISTVPTIGDVINGTWILDSL